MKRLLQTIWITTLLFSAALQAAARVDIRTLQQGTYQSVDTAYLLIDPNDNSGTGAREKVVYIQVANLSSTTSEAFYIEAEWLCSNSSVYYQFCQEYPPDYNTGTCHPFHRQGMERYDGYNYSIPPDTCGYNFLMCFLKVYDYSVEKEHEKICRFRVLRRDTHEQLDSMYLIIRRGNLPCYKSQPNPTAIHTPSADEIANIYPNPARNSITIAAKQDQLLACSLYAPDGKMVLGSDTEHRKKVELNVGGLPNGIYFLKLTDGNRNTCYRKIVVDH